MIGNELLSEEKERERKQLTHIYTYTQWANTTLVLSISNLQELTLAILHNVSITGCAIPMRKGQLMIFTRTLPWNTPKRLEFCHREHLLDAHPNVLLMLLYILPQNPLKGLHSIVLCIVCVLELAE